MSGYIDLHCHWVAGVDDGASTTDESVEMLSALRDLGFSTVIATPHMRTGMFDNTRDELEQAYRDTVREVARHDDMPELGLASEHHLDDLVFEQLMNGRGLPYASGRAALVELPYNRFPLRIEQRFFELRCKRIRPVLAHPERYRPVWNDIEVLDPLLDGGTVLLLDVGALVGKYGRLTKKTAHHLLEQGYYYAACSDAHKPKDVKEVAKGMARLRKLMGDEEMDFMLAEGPRHILDGTVEA